MNLNTSQIAEEILKSLQFKKNIKLQNSIEQVLKTHYPLEPNSLISDQAATILQKVKNQLDKKLDEWNSKKLHPQFKWGEIDTDIIISLYKQNHVNGTESESSKYKFTEEVNNFLLDIDPISFEKLGSKLIAFTGAKSFFTRSSKDQGIDFGGIIQIIPPNGNIDFSITERIFQDIALRIVGQAKRYKNSITVKEIRELHGVKHEKIFKNLASLHSNDSIINQIQDTSLPLVFIFITTSKFTSEAKKLANEIGMITMDGLQISQALIHMNIGCKRNNSGSWEFNKNEFDEWLNK